VTDKRYKDKPPRKLADLCDNCWTEHEAWLKGPTEALPADSVLHPPDREWLCGILAGLRLLKDVDVTVDDQHCRVMLRAQPDIHETFTLSELVFQADDAVVDKMEAIVGRLKRRFSLAGGE
jgi:hypothetical protein